MLTVPFTWALTELHSFHPVAPEQNMTDKCFNKCITKPGGDLSNSERVSACGSLPFTMAQALTRGDVYIADVSCKVYGPVSGGVEPREPGIRNASAA